MPLKGFLRVIGLIENMIRKLGEKLTNVRPWSWTERLDCFIHKIMLSCLLQKTWLNQTILVCRPIPLWKALEHLFLFFSDFVVLTLEIFLFISAKHLAIRYWEVTALWFQKGSQCFITIQHSESSIGTDSISAYLLEVIY